MEKIILGISALSLAFGVTVIFAPQVLVRASEAVDRLVVDLDRQIARYHVGVGVCMILAGIFLFAYGFYLGWR